MDNKADDGARTKQYVEDFIKNKSKHFFGKIKNRLTGYKDRELFIRDKKGNLAVTVKNSKIDRVLPWPT